MDSNGCFTKSCLIICLPLALLMISSCFLDAARDNLIPNLITLIVPCIILYRVYYNYIISEQENQNVKDYCERRNIKYQKSAPNDFLGRNFKLISSRSDQFSEIFNYMSGIYNGFDFSLADFAFNTPALDATSSETVYNTFCVLINKELHLPKFYICQKNLFKQQEQKPKQNNNRITNPYNLCEYVNDYKYKDIDFSDINEAFSEKYVIASDDEEALKTIFTSEICQKFVEFDNYYCFFEGKENSLMFFIHTCLKIDTKMRFLNECTFLFKDIYKVQSLIND